MDVDKALYRTDHGQISVANNKIYIAYTAMDDDHVWQLWTGVSDLDGSNYRSFQRTTDRGWIPSAVQASGDRVYYLYSKGNAIFETYSHNRVQGTAKGPKTVEGFYVASTNREGEDWKVVARVSAAAPSGDSGSFYVCNDRIHLIWVEFEPDGVRSRLYTGSMDLDGRNPTKVARTAEDGMAKTPIAGGVQVVGDRCYYVFGRSGGAGAWTLWTAESRLDGSDWSEQLVESGSRSLAVGYKGVVVVGAKRYLAPGRSPEGVLAFGGANLVNKGDAYGIGVTEKGHVRGFINAGQDFIFRGEAAIDTAGAIADDDQKLTQDRWYHVAAVFDQQRLRLYVNGAVRATTAYTKAPATNPFPLVIGDGFVGALDELHVYGRALSAAEVVSLYRRHR
jgi:hypothetical protein